MERQEKKSSGSMLQVQLHPLGRFGSSLCIPGSKVEAEEKGVWRREAKLLQFPEAEGCLWPQDAADNFQGANFRLGTSQPQSWPLPGAGR